MLFGIAGLALPIIGIFISPTAAVIGLVAMILYWIVLSIISSALTGIYRTGLRYADDFVMGFEREEDARRVVEVLPKRFAKYGLTVHPTKTRLLYFGRPPKFPTTEVRRMQPPEMFDFLAFTHYWERSEKANWVIKQKTARSRLRRAIQSVRQWCKAPSLGAQGAVETTEREAEGLLQLLRPEREHPRSERVCPRL